MYMVKTYMLNVRVMPVFKLTWCNLHNAVVLSLIYKIKFSLGLPQCSLWLCKHFTVGAKLLDVIISKMACSLILSQILMNGWILRIAYYILIQFLSMPHACYLMWGGVTAIVTLLKHG